MLFRLWIPGFVLHHIVTSAVRPVETPPPATHVP
jgi:hypothetical protein